jgi:hypothetical protein
VLADDADDDLAVLRVKGIKDPPRPIDLRANDQLIETMGLFIFGFPFGTKLATNKGNPTVTVGKGSVSSIRRNEAGELVLVQIDGDVNPGNSGGPVVDREGRLIGVSVLKVRGTNIGMAVPAPALARLVSGRIAGTRFNTVTLNNGPPEVLVDMRLFDPLQKIKTVAVHFVRRAAVKEQLKQDAKGRWPPLPGAEKVDAKIEGQRATARLPVKPPEKSDDAFLIQVSYVSDDGKTRLLQPQPLEPQGAPPVVAAGPEQPGANPPPVQRPPVQPVPPQPPPAPPQPPKEERVALTDAELNQALEDLKAADGFRRRGALDKLAKAEPKTRRDEVLRALDPVFGDSDGGLRTVVVKVAALWGPKECVTALLKLLKDDWPFVRMAVLEAFGQLKDERTVEAVAECVPKDRGPASAALRAMGSMAEKAVIKLLRHEDWGVQLEACNILKDIGTKESIAPLEEAAAQDKGQLVKNASKAAIQAINVRNGPRYFLSDLEAFDVQSGPMPVSAHGQLGNGQDRITVNGTLSPKGVGMHPPPAPGYAAAKYRLNKSAAVFRAVVAINDTTTWCWSPATFTVLGDGKPLWQSKAIAHNWSRSQECLVDVSGVEVLELRVQVLNGNQGVHAVWVEPRLLQKPDTPDVDAPPVLFAAGPREYLSDLNEIDVRAGPWPLSKNGVIGPEKNPIAVGGVRSPKGLGLHPPDSPGYAAVKYRLGKQAAVFKAAVALNGTAQIVFSQAVFEVYGDDKRLWQSAPAGKDTRPQECSLDVGGVDMLELRVSSQGSHLGLHAVWLEPRLLQKADTPDEK